ATRVSAAHSRRGTTLFRPGIEVLEGRTLMSFTASIDVKAVAENEETGQNNTQDTQSNPGNATATWNDVNGTVTATSSGSFGITQSIFTGNGSINADEHVSGRPFLGAFGNVAIVGSLIASAPETAEIGIDLEFDHNPDTSARGGVDIDWNNRPLIDVAN